VGISKELRRLSTLGSHGYILDSLGAYAQCSRLGVTGRFRALLATAGRNGALLSLCEDCPVWGTLFLYKIQEGHSRGCIKFCDVVNLTNRI